MNSYKLRGEVKLYANNVHKTTVKIGFVERVRAENFIDARIKAHANLTHNILGDDPGSGHISITLTEKLTT